MRPGSSPISESEIESVTVQLGNLDITITVRPSNRSTVQPSIGSGYPSSAAVRESSPEHLEWFSIPGHLDAAARAASSPSELAALALPQLNNQRAQLRGASAEWVPAARVGRAFRAGVFARGRLEGEIFSSGSESLSIPFKNGIYIVLRSAAGGGSFWTSSYNTYIQGVRSSSGGFHSSSISHAFATRAEADCFLAGARRQWPVQA